MCQGCIQKFAKGMEKEFRTENLEFRVWKKDGGGGGGQKLNSVRGVLHMLSLWHAKC